MRLPLFLPATLLICAALPVSASVRWSSEQHIWSLTSGPIEYRIGQRPEEMGAVSLLYFGPTGGASWSIPKRPYTSVVRQEIGGLVDGQELRPEFLTLIKQEIVELTPDRSELHLYFKDKFAPLEVEAVYTTFGDTGVITKALTFHNAGTRDLQMERAPSLSLRLPPATYELSYLRGGWGEERQLKTVPILDSRISFVNQSGRSSNGYSPWFALRDQDTGVRYAAQLAYSGNWDMSFEQIYEKRHVERTEQDLRVDMGMRFDFGEGAPLHPGKSFSLPTVAFTASAGDLDDIANQLHRFQRRYVFAHSPANFPPLVTFNVWQLTQRNPHAAEMKHYADVLAPLGIEAVLIDSGWFMHSHTPTSTSPTDPTQPPIFGDWDPDPEEFPEGLANVAEYVHSKGMKFGVWVEIECVSRQSHVAREHPDWILKYNGAPLQGTLNRVYLDFNKPEVRAWAAGVLERLVTREKVDWLKLDYNVNLEESFDPAAASARTGTVLHDHLQFYFAMLDKLRRDHPSLVIENCSSGALRTDLAIMHYMDTTWTSDVVEPKRNVQLDYGCTLEFAPEICNHWMVGETDNGMIHPTGSQGWYETMLRLPMAGQMSFSSKVGEWPEAFRKTAVQAITDYKRIRPIIATSDVYHLTPPPDAGEAPRGWMALEFVAPTSDKVVLLAFRLTHSRITEWFHPRGLDPGARYRITGQGVTRGTFTGKELADTGISVSLSAEWNSSLIELNKLP